MHSVAAFFSWIGVVVFAGLFYGTFAARMDGEYSGTLAQWVMHELIQGGFLGLSVWGAIRSWRRRRALPPAERSRLGMGCLAVAVACVAAVMGVVLTARSTNRKVADTTKALVPPVIAALDRYKAANREYPGTLEQLVPGYLPVLPQCTLGDDRPAMSYRREGSGHYELACPASFVMRWRYRYRSETGEWGMVD